MNSLYVCLNAVAPIFLIMAAGYAAKCAGFIKEEYVPWMNGVLFKVFIPIMCFYNIYSSDLSQGIRPFYVFFLIISILIEYILSLIFGTLFVRDTSRRGVVIQGLYRSNFLFVGIPLAASFLGEGSMGVVAISSAIVAPMFNILRFLRGLSLSPLVGVASLRGYRFFFTRIVLGQQFPVLYGIFFLLNNINVSPAVP